MHRYFAPCKRIQDSLGFWTSCHGFQIPVTEFRILCQWNLDSKAQDSEFHKQNFPGFRFKIAPCKVIWVPELEKFRLVESGILEFGIWNSA